MKKLILSVALVAAAALSGCSSTPTQEVQALATPPTTNDSGLGFDVRDYDTPTEAMAAAVQHVEAKKVAADAAAWQMADLCIGYITETYPLLTARAMYETLTPEQYDDNKFIADTIRQLHVDNAALMSEFVEHGGGIAHANFQTDVQLYSKELSNCLNYTAEVGLLEPYLQGATNMLKHHKVSNISWNKS